MAPKHAKSVEEKGKHSKGFLGLPEKIREQIYRLVLLQGNKQQHEGITYSLEAHPLLHVNRLIRTETMPIYYGDNDFHLALPCGGPSENNRFKHMCSCLGDSGALQHICQLTAIYTEEIWDVKELGSDDDSDDSQVGTYQLSTDNFRFGFAMVGGVEGDFEDDIRIGDDDLDWHNPEARAAAFREALVRDMTRMTYRQLTRRVPVQDVAEQLFYLAEHCVVARAYVVLIRKLGQD